MQLYVIALALFGFVAADVSHLQHPGYSYIPAALPGSDSSSYQPEHLIPQHLKAAQGVPGGDSSSYQPEHLIPQHLKASAVPSLGADTQTPEQFIPQADRIAHQQSTGYEGSFNLGGDTQTPEQFIPQADRNAHYSYVQSQAKAVLPGGDSSSYQPEHLIPQHLKAAQNVPGGDSSSYQPEHLIPQHLKATPVPTLGADTQTPEQFIPEADRIAHIHVQATGYEESFNLGGDTQTPENIQSQAAVPGGDSSSYQPQHLIPQNLQPAQVQSTTGYEGSFNLGADTQTPEQFIPEADRIAHANYVQQQQQQVPAAIGAETITPAHLYQEPVSNGIEEFNPETHVPAAIGGDTITPAHLVPKFSSHSSSSASSSSHDTQYGSNGGYVY